MKKFFLVWFIWLYAVSALYVKPKLALEDDFYIAPDNIDDYSEGDVIRHRPAPGMIRSIYYPIEIKNAWQFLVRSTDSRGNATAIVTTVLEPFDADPTKLLSYQFAEDSASIDCSPSYSILFGAKMDTVVLQAEMILLTTGLSRGWFVVAPDYEGPQGAFTAGRQAGHATLDSIRAVLNTQNITRIDPDAKVAMWGYSGGTIASGWAAQLQPKYAPELKDNLIGVAVGGWVTNITLTAQATDQTIFAGLIPNCINGIILEFPYLKDTVYNSLNEDRRDWFFRAKDQCLLNSIFKYAFHNFFSGLHPYFKDGWSFFQMEEIKEIVDYNTLALTEDQGYPEIPMFVFHSTADEVVPFPGAQRAYENYCDWGIDSLEFAVSNSTGHVLEVVEGSGAAIKWLSDRFEGKDPVKGCKKTVRRTNLEYPGADLSYYQIARTLYTSFSGEIGVSYPRNTTSTEAFDDKYEWVVEQLTKIGPIPFKKRADQYLIE
ncbi:CIC11C00000000171 [Sungouiella intermedia]|uniref:CIC11C00000000171 n=1 Tax=Sungouiella intermedia TaxID=45354 RepID=A0A1L0CTX6_9ASCO|nr:CIC11C00000000171 [[Candida] intermedia]